MAKQADPYLLIDPWAVVEEGFDPARNRVSESIFSLGNEYMGVRGYADEGYTGDSLVGSYFNGLFEEFKIGPHYKGITRQVRFMVNAVNWLDTEIRAEGEKLDLAASRISGFRRKLDLRRGTYAREFVWHLPSGAALKLSFLRFVSMTNTHVGCQRVRIESVGFEGAVSIRSGLDLSVIHEDQGKNLWVCERKSATDRGAALLGRTVTTGNRLFSGFRLTADGDPELAYMEGEKTAAVEFALTLAAGQETGFSKVVTNLAVKDAAAREEQAWSDGAALLERHTGLTLDGLLAEHEAAWERIWTASDIVIEGDPENQQGIRFCVFQMHQTYHGDNPGLNIGAKGLTGEAYRGLAFWDTESYCLPFYLFNNPKAARSLLDFRYNTLPEARERARDVDCKGACYPIATIDGTESCDLWQHSNTQLHVGTAVAYGLWHYVKITGDRGYLYEKGVEMLIEISRFYATRGQWSQRTGRFGYFGVMGPDEFQLMVNHNGYINYMAKELFDYARTAVAEMRRDAPDGFAALAARIGFDPEEAEEWARLAEAMYIPQEEATGIFEEHEGFFDMPHLDIHSIPVTDFPLYAHWSYDRIYRYDMIKQPDVLMFLFLYNSRFDERTKRANYEYYEPRCIHESSLSPSIHSILASELGKHDEAYRFFEFASRLDLDNYNRNTREGLHTTSIAAAWMNIVYGFGGMRSDGDGLSFAPSIPAAWTAYRFKLTYGGALLAVDVTPKEVGIVSENGTEVAIRLYGRECLVDGSGVRVPLEQRLALPQQEVR